MSGQRAEQERRLAEVLTKVVQQLGPARLGEVDVLRALLNDTLGVDGGGLRREVELVVRAAAEGAGMLGPSAGPGAAGTVLSRLTALAVEPGAAQWAVDAWAAALGAPQPRPVVGTPPTVVAAPAAAPFTFVVPPAEVSPTPEPKRRRKGLLLAGSAVAVATAVVAALVVVGAVGGDDAADVVQQPPPAPASVKSAPQPATTPTAKPEAKPEPAAKPKPAAKPEPETQPAPAPTAKPARPAARAPWYRVPTKSAMAALLPPEVNVGGQTLRATELTDTTRNPICPGVFEPDGEKAHVTYVYGDVTRNRHQVAMGLGAWATPAGARAYMQELQHRLRTCSSAPFSPAESAEVSSRCVLKLFSAPPEDVFYGTICGYTSKATGESLGQTTELYWTIREGNVVAGVGLGTSVSHGPAEDHDVDFVRDRIARLRIDSARLVVARD